MTMNSVADPRGCQGRTPSPSSPMRPIFFLLMQLARKIGQNIRSPSCESWIRHWSPLDSFNVPGLSSIVFWKSVAIHTPVGYSALHPQKQLRHVLYNFMNASSMFVMQKQFMQK